MANEYQILINAKGNAVNEFERTKGAVKRATLSVKGLGDAFDYSERKMKAFAGRFIGLGALFAAANSALNAMKSELKASVKAYEDFSRATGVKDENIKRMDELREKHELLRIELGEKLLPYWVSVEEGVNRWISGVIILIDKIDSLKKAPVNQDQWSAVPSDAPLPDISGKKPLNAKTKAQLEAEKKAQDVAEKDISEAVKAEEKRQEERIKAIEEGNAIIAKMNDELRNRREALQKEENEKQASADENKWNAIVEARAKKEEEQTKKHAEEVEKRKKKSQEEAELEIRARYMVAGAWASMSGNVANLLTIMGGEQRKYMNAVKAFAIGEAVISTAVAAAKANSATPYPPVNALLMAEAIVQGGVQIAAIAAQSFAKGGVTDGGPAMLHPNEVILNPKQQANMLFAMANGQSGGSRVSNISPTVNINISGSADRNTVRELEMRIPAAIARAVRSGAMDDTLVDMSRRQRVAK
jgi:hypothetical protein